MHRLTMDQRWDLVRVWVEAGAAWFFYAIAHIDSLIASFNVEQLLKSVALLFAIGASAMAMASSYYLIKKTKRDIEKKD